MEEEKEVTWRLHGSRPLDEPAPVHMWWGLRVTMWAFFVVVAIFFSFVRLELQYHCRVSCEDNSRNACRGSSRYLIVYTFSKCTAPVRNGRKSKNTNWPIWVFKKFVLLILASNSQAVPCKQHLYNILSLVPPCCILTDLAKCNVKLHKAIPF